MSESPLQPWTINCLKCLCLMFMRWRGNKQVLHSPKNHRTHVGGRALNMYYFWDGEIPPSVSEASQECKRKSYTLFTHSKIFEKKKNKLCSFGVIKSLGDTTRVCWNWEIYATRTEINFAAIKMNDLFSSRAPLPFSSHRFRFELKLEIFRMVF